MCPSRWTGKQPEPLHEKRPRASVLYLGLPRSKLALESKGYNHKVPGMGRRVLS